MDIDRVELNRAMSKAIAFKQCGKQQQANVWAARLLYLLDCMDVADQSKLDQYAREWED